MKRTALFRGWRICALSVALIGPAISAAADEDNKVVVTRSTNSFASLTYYAANAMGAFSDLGLEIEEVRTGAGSKSLAAIVSGDADIYLGSTASVLKARGQGVPVQMFAPVVRQLTSSVVVSKAWAEAHGIDRQSPLADKLAALKGARIAVSGPGSGSDQALRYIAAEAGVDPDREMEIVPMGADARTYLGAMDNGRIDGFSTSPPDTHVAEKDFGATILVNTAAGELPALDGYFYIAFDSRQDWIENNPTEAARMAAGLQMAMDAIHDPERTDAVGEAVRAMYYPEMDSDLFRRVWADQVHSVPTSLDVSDADLLGVVDFYNRFAETPMPPEMIEGAYNHAPAEAAVQYLTTN
ncbi:ABC transporter substrate-binding protein [Salipiger sp.]|uniref:ABC transporter substrate-binding protein n=1 Tax=Salipiger sp. TaxID=2078585 RepID=UPI003A985A90